MENGEIQVILESRSKPKDFVTSHKMLDWQYFQILGDLQEIQRHGSDPTCPCRLSDDLGENCLAKHSLGLSVIAAETSAMDEANSKMLLDLSAEAKERHETMKSFLCHTKDAPEFTKWSRQWRKRIEPLYYHASCKVKLSQAAKLQFDPLLSAIGCQIGVGCMANSIKSELPVCNSEQKTRLENCIIDVKAKLPKGCGPKEWNKPQGERLEGCYNPFAVCSSSVGCKLKGNKYDKLEN
jgi:hypothetical protein